MIRLGTFATAERCDGRVQPATPLAPVGTWLDEFDELREALWSEIAGPLRASELGFIGAQFELDGYRAHIAALAAAPVSEEAGAPSGAMVIAGLARTGTTLLHALLDASGAGHAPRCWETYAYGAPPGSAQANAAVAMARARVDLVQQLSPRLFGLHPFGAFDPEECTPTVAASLISQQTAFMFPCPRFEERIADADDHLMYALWKRQITLLGRGTELPLILKSPLHLGHYRRILSISPDARIVQIRRPVEEVVRSSLNLAEVARGIFAGAVDPISLGREWMTRFEQLIDTGSAESSAVAPRITVVEYRDLRQRPVETVEHLASLIGCRPIDGDAIHAVAQGLAARHNSELRPLERYGLRPAQVRRALRTHLDGPLVS